MAVLHQIQLRFDLAANWATEDPTPAKGEVCFETDTQPYKMKVGDGSTAYSSLPYSPYGDVEGPATNTDEYVPQWNGADSKTLKNGKAVVTTLGSPGSDANIATEQAIRAAISDAGGGDVSGPSSSTDARLAVFSGTSGKLIDESTRTMTELEAWIRLQALIFG